MDLTVIRDGVSNEEMFYAFVPEGWTTKGSYDPSCFTGYMAPISYIAAANKDNITAMSHASPRNYCDDGTNQDGSRSNNVSYIFNKYRPFDALLDSFAKQIFPEHNIKCVETRYDSIFTPENIDKLTKQQLTAAAARAKKSSNSVSDFTVEEVKVEGGIKIYDVTCSDGTGAFRCAISAMVKADKIKITPANGANAVEKNAISWNMTDYNMLTSPVEEFEENYVFFTEFISTIRPAEPLTAKMAKEYERRVAAAKPKYEYRVVKDEHGVETLKVKLKKGWSVGCKRINSYFGYNRPFGYTVDAYNENKTVHINHLCSVQYVDLSKEKRKPYDTGNIDLYGNLCRQFMTIDKYIDEQAQRDIGGYGAQFIEQRNSIISPNADFDKLTKECFGKEVEESKINKPLRTINFTYLYEIVRIYKYNYNGHERMRAYNAKIDATSYIDYYEVPQMDSGLAGLPGGGLMGLLGGVMPNLYPNAIKTPDGRLLDPCTDRISWFVTNRLYLDAPASEFEENYNDAFAEFGRNWKRMPQVADEMEKEQRLKDEDLAEARRIYGEMEDNSRKIAAENAEYIRKTNKEIAEINNSVYRNKQETFDRTNKRWSESFNGRYTYTDSYGSEYNVSGYGKYTYKKGSRIINTDNPYPPGADWEELKKKY